MASKISVADAIKAQDIASLLQITEIGEVNAYMRGVDEGYNSAEAGHHTAVTSAPDTRNFASATGWWVGVTLFRKSLT